MHNDLLELKKLLENLLSRIDNKKINVPLDRLDKAVSEVQKAFSGSWLGYHANIYYRNLQSPPPGAHFSLEWGLNRFLSLDIGTTGDWVEYSREDIQEYILSLAQYPDIDSLKNNITDCYSTLDTYKRKIILYLHTYLKKTNDNYLSGLLQKIIEFKDINKHDIIEHLKPNGQIITRDTTALSQGIKIPPHIYFIIEILFAKYIYDECKELIKIIDECILYLSKMNMNIVSINQGTKIFIGHGNSKLWRELKDFIEDRLKLQWDEFNRIPIAGISNTSRLNQMLNNSCFAFLILTAEDELSNGNFQARMNVIHEVGLFQGRLGFEKAIILLEEGCAEFSNINGLGQIRFPKNKISAIFEDIRCVLEREGILSR